MTVAKIHDVVLYTSSTENPVDCHAAKAWMDHSGIVYTHLNYNDAEQLPDVLAALNTWWAGKEVTTWPFVVFMEQHKGMPITRLTANFIEGLENIKDKLLNLSSL